VSRAAPSCNRGDGGVSTMGGAMGVFFRALILAERECAPKIRVDHLLAALEVAPTEERPVPPTTGPFLPCEHRDMFFSSEAEALIGSLGGLEGTTLDRLRTALLATKSNVR
jgi:hypothetical protein